LQTKRDSVTGPLPAWLRARGGGFSIEVHVQPGARRSQVVGLHGDRLKLAVHAPPTEGRANTAVNELIAERLDCRPSAVQIAAGASSRDKRLQIEDVAVTASRIVERLQPAK
jgi:uncharacterized protein (TIGR00251 family)